MKIILLHIYLSVVQRLLEYSDIWVSAWHLKFLQYIDDSSDVYHEKYRPKFFVITYSSPLATFFVFRGAIVVKMTIL